ncbi:MAG: universal stress protein [Dehalococcoidia bacterium]|nr:universal stress protein [Dehalococcoidia bacterium]
MNSTDSRTRLIVALDGSKLAETVIPLVQSLAACLAAEVTLFHSLEAAPPQTVHGESHLNTFLAAESYLAGVARRLHDAGFNAATHVHAEPTREVAAGIAGHAAELKADMIVLAAHGSGGFKDWLIGRIPQQVLALIDRPVLIVPIPTDRSLAGESAIELILLPVDPAGDAAAAIPVVQRIAGGCQAETLLLSVIPTAATMPGEAGVASIFLPRTATRLLDWAEDEMRARLVQLGESFGKVGLATSTEVRRGDPAAEILAVLRRKDGRCPDLVVLATHARAGLDGMLAGSVTPRVVGGSPCPLLLVPLAS